jgi:hypothetical protein
MEIKERHYRQIAQLVRRDQGDNDTHMLEGDPATMLNALQSIVESRTLGPPHPELVPTADGAIERILLTVPNYAVDDAAVAQAYRSLLSALPPSLRLVVLTQKSCEASVRTWLANSHLSARAEVNALDDMVNISIWAEDAYVVAKDSDNQTTYFVEPFSFPRYADSLVAEHVSDFTDLKHSRVPLYFQGGNVLIGDDFFLIGADYPAISLRYVGPHKVLKPLGVPPKDLIKSLYRQYLDHDRNVIYVGSQRKVPTEQKRETTINHDRWREVICAGNSKGTVQPLFHIDMFITLVGPSKRGYKLLVGDPFAASKLLGGDLPTHAMPQVFDDIATQLTALGFDVERNPLPLIYMDDLQHKERMWYFASANNALVQNSPVKKVWLPTYGYGAWKELAKTDEANAQIWRELGFDVNLLGDFHPFAESLGAVHCIKKYLARG